MSEPVVASINVNYTNYEGKKVSKSIKFIGNFGFNIGGENNTQFSNLFKGFNNIFGASKYSSGEYHVENGKVYDSLHNEINELNLSTDLAYQFIGMSNTADLAKDYTFSQKDINEAHHYFRPDQTYYDSNEKSTRINSIIGGNFNGDVTFKDGKYTTRDNNEVSIWKTAE